MVGLGHYLDIMRDVHFDWASNNCMSFVSGALQACGRPGLPDEWCIGYTTAAGALASYRRCLREFGYSDILSAFDDIFERVLTLHPSDGMICARKADGVMGHAFGVAYGSRCIFLTDQGPMSFDVEAGDLFWRAA